MTKDQEKARITALTRLALATREKVDAATYVLYVEDTAGFSTAVMVEACHRLETRSSWFPKVAELIDECRVVGQRHQERLEEQARLSLPEAPLSEERFQQMLNDIRELLDRKGMTGESRPAARAGREA